jgi:hypothetical protein
LNGFRNTFFYQAYNVRALGSLEAENLLGEFQDLNPKGVGVLRPDDIPIATHEIQGWKSIKMYILQKPVSKI